MDNKKENYEYLLRLYSEITEYLADNSGRKNNLPEMIVNFCIVVERIFKIRLHKENPFLVYEIPTAKYSNDGLLIAIAKLIDVDVRTIKIEQVLERYKIMFEGEFSDNELELLKDIYEIRNNLVHGWKSDETILSDKENIIKKMGTVWEKISKQAVSLFGQEKIKINKPEKKYTKKELEKVIEDEVSKKIQPIKNQYISVLNGSRGIHQIFEPISISSPGLIGERCPRCGSEGFSLNNSDFLLPIDIVSPTNILSTGFYQQNYFSDLYKCKKCNLELTRREYDIARRLKDK